MSNDSWDFVKPTTGLGMLTEVGYSLSNNFVPIPGLFISQQRRLMVFSLNIRLLERQVGLDRLILFNQNILFIYVFKKNVDIKQRKTVIMT